MAEENKKEEVKTEVTSIAEEEEKSGQKVDLPSPEELVARASSSFISTRQTLSTIMNKTSKRGLVRAILAGLDMPMQGLPVKLQKQEEKQIFMLIQRMIGDRFLITQHHINQESKKRREEESVKAETEEDSNDKNKEENDAKEKTMV